jgi:hypothetical protein
LSYFKKIQVVVADLQTEPGGGTVGTPATAKEVVSLHFSRKSAAIDCPENNQGATLVDDTS